MSLTDLVDSSSPQVSPAVTWSPTCGRETYTMSPRASCAKSVIPTRTEPSVSPGLRTHSCSLVYLRFSGYTRTPWRWGVGWVGGAGGAGVSGRLLAAAGLRILRSFGLAHAGDVDGLELLDLDRGPVVGLQRLDRPGREGERRAQDVGVADHLEGVRRLEELAVELDATHRAVEGAVRADADRVVELHRLGAGRAELLDGVEQRPDVDPAGRLGDRHPQAGAGDGHQAGDDVERLDPLLGLVEGRGPRPALVGQLVAPGLEPADLASRPLGRAGQAVEHLDQLALAQAAVGVVGLRVLHLYDEREAEDGEQHGDDD